MITIIVPVYNAYDYLKECLTSIEKQGYTDFEVLMVNDASTDHSMDICKEYEARDKRFHLINNIKNEGVCSALNKGVMRAKGSYICFVDADDRIESDFLSKLIYEMEKSNADCVACDFFDEAGMEHPEWGYTVSTGADIFDKYLEGYFYNRKANKMYRASVVRKVSFPEDRPVKEDAYWTANILLHCHRIVYIPEGLYYYRKVENSLSHNYNLPQELIVGSFYNDLVKYSILYRNISCGLMPLFYERFDEWAVEVLLSFYNLNLHGFFKELRLFVTEMEKSSPVNGIILYSPNYKKAAMTQLRKELVDRHVSIRRKCVLLYRLIKRRFINRQ